MFGSENEPVVVDEKGQEVEQEFDESENGDGDKFQEQNDEEDDKPEAT